MTKSDLLTRLEPWGQEHLVRWWDELALPQQTQLAAQIEATDFALVDQLSRLRSTQIEAHAPARAKLAQAPTDLVRHVPGPLSPDLQRAFELGEALLSAGHVAAILVAGGQGSRLGFDGPKGTFPIGPVSSRSLFQVLCEQLLARSRRAGKPIPLLVMTSDATHADTVTFFSQQQSFGLPPQHVHFFQQASLPALEADSSRIVMADKGSLQLSPDGHGGVLRALKKAGLLELMQQQGIKQFYYHQVDNPTAIVCDPLFLGMHVESGSEMSTKVVAKTHPHEKMGVVVTIQGQTQIIEYSDLSPEDAVRTNGAGQPIFWAGNMAIHAFRLDFLQRLTHGEIRLPFHIAFKPVTYLNEQGKVVQAHPQQPNAHKFEQFIFDALPQATRALVFEADRAREFNPVKNQSGADSPETSRAALIRIATEWITAAGGTIGPGVPVEISPLWALDAAECQQRLTSHAKLLEPTVFGETKL